MSDDQMHDFGDGCGLVLARRHANGGGWVACTAQVYGGAWVYLTTTDHGYVVTANWVNGEWRVVAGCRDFSFSEAREHWGSRDYHSPQSGSRILAVLDWLAAQPQLGGAA